MPDIKQLKGSMDLAAMNHASHQNDDSKASLDTAKAAYKAAVAAGTNNGDDEARLATKKAAAKEAVGKVLTKSSTNSAGGDGSATKEADQDPTAETGDTGEKKSA